MLGMWLCHHSTPAFAAACQKCSTENQGSEVSFVWFHISSENSCEYSHQTASQRASQEYWMLKMWLYCQYESEHGVTH